MRVQIYKSSVAVFTTLFLGCLSLSNYKELDVSRGKNSNKIELYEKKWNLVHYLNSSTEQALKVAQHLIDRKALKSNTESETVIIVDQMAGFEEKLVGSGFRVLYYNSIDLNDARSKLPIMIIFDQENKVQYMGTYFKDKCPNCKVNDLIPYIKTKLKKQYGVMDNSIESSDLVKNLIKPLKL